MKRLSLFTSLIVGLLCAVGCEDDTAVVAEDIDAVGCEDDTTVVAEDIDQLTIDLFNGIGAGAGPWETLGFDLSSEPTLYVYGLHEPAVTLCSVEGYLTAEQTDTLLARLADVRYAQFETDSITADQPTRTIQLRAGEESTWIYHLFDSDWADEFYPEEDFLFATSGADELLQTVSTLTEKCQPL